MSKSGGKIAIIGSNKQGRSTPATSNSTTTTPIRTQPKQTDVSQTNQAVKRKAVTEVQQPPPKNDEIINANKKSKNAPTKDDIAIIEEDEQEEQEEQYKQITQHNEFNGDVDDDDDDSIYESALHSFDEKAQQNPQVTPADTRASKQHSNALNVNTAGNSTINDTVNASTSSQTTTTPSKQERQGVKSVHLPLPDAAQKMIHVLKDFNSMQINRWIKLCKDFDPLVLAQVNMKQEITDDVKASLNIHKIDMSEWKYKKILYKNPKARGGFIVTWGTPIKKSDAVISPTLIAPPMMLIYLGTGIEDTTPSKEDNQNHQQQQQPQQAGDAKFFAGFSDEIPENIKQRQPALCAQLYLYIIHTHIFSRKLLELSMKPENKIIWPGDGLKSLREKFIMDNQERVEGLSDEQLDKEVEENFYNCAQKMFNRKDSANMMSISRPLIRDMTTREKTSFAAEKEILMGKFNADPNSVSEIDKLKLQKEETWQQPYIEEKQVRLPINFLKGIENPCPAIASPLNFMASIFVKDGSDLKKGYGVKLGWSVYSDKNTRELCIYQRLPKNTVSHKPPEWVVLTDDDDEDNEKNGNNAYKNDANNNHQNDDNHDDEIHNNPPF